MAKGEERSSHKIKKAPRLYNRRYARGRNGPDWNRNQECSTARINLKDGFAQVKKMGSLAEQCSYRPLKRAISGTRNLNAVAKLLLHKKQIQKLEQETKGTGMTLVPLKVYIKMVMPSFF